MTRGRRAQGEGPDARQTVRLAQLERQLEFFNAEMAGKVSRTLAEYHETWIGTPPGGPSVDRRLYIVERLSVKWWIASLFLWARDVIRARFFPPPPVYTKDCGHPAEALAVRPDEPQMPCPECGMGLLLPLDKEEADGEVSAAAGG